MRYKHVCRGTFIARPNRFIAHVDVAGRTEVCHVKNTGRCKELLVPGATVILEIAESPTRKTKYDVIAVYKGERLINMDSQAPNKVAGESVSALFPGVVTVRSETIFGDSRLDFYIETENRRIFMEVKGVTLEENGVALFPDAPTLRGVKHIQELCRCLEQGYEAVLLFVIQMGDISRFQPNDRTHRAFGDALRAARDQGVRLLAMDCSVEEDRLELRAPVDIIL